MHNLYARCILVEEPIILCHDTLITMSRQFYTISISISQQYTLNKEHYFVPCEHILSFTFYYLSFHSTHASTHDWVSFFLASNFIYQLTVHYSECVYIYTDM